MVTLWAVTNQLHIAYRKLRLRCLHILQVMIFFHIDWVPCILEHWDAKIKHAILCSMKKYLRSWCKHRFSISSYCLAPYKENGHALVATSKRFHQKSIKITVVFLHKQYLKFEERWGQPRFHLYSKLFKPLAILLISKYFQNYLF